MHAELALRILVGTVLGSVIGYERDVHGRPAGLRTHALVALASATFMVVSTHFIFFQGYQEGQLVEADASRIAASVVSGMGFLAGGAILRTGLTVQGLTTAAALWLVAAIGLAAGGGMFVESGLVTLLGVTALTLLRRFEDKDERTLARRHLSITLGEGAPPIASLVKKLEALGAHVTERGQELDVVAKTTTAALDVRLASTITVEQVVIELGREAGVLKLRLDAPH